MHLYDGIHPNVILTVSSAVLTEGNQKHSSVVTEERIQVSHGVFERCVLPAFFVSTFVFWLI